MTPREVVRRTIKFEKPERIAHDLWVLPRAKRDHPKALNQLEELYPPDFTLAPLVYEPSPRLRGDRYEIGTYVDEWGCEFTNLQYGMIGQPKKPLVENLSHWKNIKPPYEILPYKREAAIDTVNRACASTDRFVVPDHWARPWERYQFIRTSLEALMDMALLQDESKRLLENIHSYYMKEMEFWVKTDVDAVKIMDDWGSQRALLISPETWREWFKPLYRDYCQLAHAHNKFALMHSDGNIQDIYDDLVEVGVDALNSQLGCMDLDYLSRNVKGKITFWGEIDRQHVLTSKDTEVGRSAVREIAKHLYDEHGGVIAQFEFGAEINPLVGFAVFDEWDKVVKKQKQKA
jgi:uroporphyrinogen decarboxylase